MKLKHQDIVHVHLAQPEGELKVGRLIELRGKIYFEYDADFLTSGIELSPFQLANQGGVFEGPSTPADFEGLFGVFNDSLPDGWGRLLLDRAVRNKGIAHESLTPLDRLAHTGAHGMGALTYRPDLSDPQKSDEFLDLDALAQEMNTILAGESSEVIEQLIQWGGSSAGARPKITAGFDQQNDQVIHGSQDLPDTYEHWLIKFPSSNDMRDIANVEHAYAKMATTAGLVMPPVHLFEGKKDHFYFGAKRFDREGNQRIHMHSAAGMLHTSHRYPNLDYEQLLRYGWTISQDVNDLEQLFRLACFNVLSHNRDDHSKNFSFLMDHQGKWSAAPAYDLTFSFGPGGEQSTTVLGEGRAPSTKHLLELAQKFGIKQGKHIIDEVQAVVHNWKAFAQDSGVSKASIRIVQKAIDAIK